MAWNRGYSTILVLFHALHLDCCNIAQLHLDFLTALILLDATYIARLHVYCSTPPMLLNFTDIARLILIFAWLQYCSAPIILLVSSYISGLHLYCSTPPILLDSLGPMILLLEWYKYICGVLFIMNIRLMV